MWFKRKQITIPIGGAIPSPIDKRDVLTSEVFPLPVRIAPDFPPPFDLTILNQGNTPHCVGYSSATIKQEKELRERNSLVFDGDWIYDECKKIDNYTGNGTYLRVAMKVLQKTGAKPKDEADSEAIQYRIGGYAKVDDLSFEGLKKAIYVNGILLAGFHGSNTGWQTAYVRSPKSGEETWGHAVALIGYNKNYIIGQNSWGNWGDGGLFYVSKDYMPFEAWAILSDLPLEFLPSSSLEGWVAQEYLKTDNFIIGSEVYPYTRLNIRKEPSGEKILTLNKNQKCIVVSEPIVSGNYHWVKVKVI